MIINILDTFLDLQATKSNFSQKSKEISFLLEQVRLCSLDPNTYIKQSQPVITHLEQNTLDEAIFYPWLNYSRNIYASYLSVKLYENSDLVSICFVDRLLAFFEDKNLSLEIRSFGKYSCAHLLSIEQPQKCYALTMESFTLNPELGRMLGVDYTFDPDESNQRLTTVCPICNSTECTPHYCSPQVLKLEKNNLFSPAKLWVKCDCCHNYYTYNFPLEKVSTINGHYTKDLTSTHLKPRFPLDLYNDIFINLTRLTKGRSYLEIGVGTGEMLAIAQEFGFQVEGVEICKEDGIKISSALKVDIHLCDIVNFSTPKKYDVIVLGDVLEHVTNPTAVIEKIASMMSEDGVLWLSTPNYNCAYARMEKFSHCMWHELNHFTYFSKETLETLLANFQLKIVTYQLSKRYIGSMELCIMKITN